MRSLVVITVMLIAGSLGLNAQDISYIETTKSWYYIYDQQGRKTKGLSTNIGELKGYSSKILVVKNNSWIYIYDAKGVKIKAMSVYTVGDVLSVAGETFTSRLGSWIYTWDKNGKKISARSAY